MRGALKSLSTTESKAAALAELRACYRTHDMATEEATPFDDKTLEISLSAACKARAAAAFAEATPDKPSPTESAERRKRHEQTVAARNAAATAATTDKAKAKATKQVTCKTLKMPYKTLKQLRHLACASDWFVSMDLANGYYALGIREEDRDFFTVN
eukprot:jgi/Tetstr1/448989/TSEL_036214.t1